MLKAAEEELTMCKWESADPAKREKINKKRSEQKSYLDPRILQAESRRPFLMAKRQEFEGGDYDKILTEAEKSRIFFILLDKI
jgi:hypothetical protein